MAGMRNAVKIVNTNRTSDNDFKTRIPLIPKLVMSTETATDLVNVEATQRTDHNSIFEGTRSN